MEQEPIQIVNELEEKGAAKPPTSPWVVKLGRYRSVLRSHWWVLVLTVGASILIGGWYNLSKIPKFRSVGRMMVSGQISLPGNVSYSEDGANFFGTQASLMESQTVRVAAAERVKARRPELTPCPVSINASQQPRASIFILQGIGDSPEYTQAFLDAVMQEYINAKKGMRSEKSDMTVSAISEELEVLEKKIKAGDEELVEFRKENNISFIQAEAANAGAYLSAIDKKLADLNTEYQLLSLLSLEQTITRKSSEKAATSPALAASGEDPLLGAGFGAQADYSKARQEIQLLQAKMADFATDLKPKHPIMVQLSSQISLQEKLLAIYQEQSKIQLADQKESVRLQIENLQNQRKVWSEKALDLSGRSASYDALKSKVDRLKGLYDHLLTAMQSVDVNKKLDQNVVAILEKASPSVPVKLGLIDSLIAALLIGVLAGLAILVICDFLNDRVISGDEFCTKFDDRILGRIPVERGAKEIPILCPEDPTFAEGFNGIRSSILFHPEVRGRSGAILVTSAVPNEGKSTVASNLAATLAAGGARTLLVDADLRRGKVHELFKVPNEKGFTEVITGSADWKAEIQSTPFENLSILSRGKGLSNPGKHLLSQCTDEFIAKASQAFDFVIFDSSPLLAVDDTAILAPKVGTVIGVVRLGYSTTRAIRAATVLLRDRQVRSLGTVLNAFDYSSDGYTYYGYSKYYSRAIGA